MFSINDLLAGEYADKYACILYITYIIIKKLLYVLLVTNVLYKIDTESEDYLVFPL